MDSEERRQIRRLLASLSATMVPELSQPLASAQLALDQAQRELGQAHRCRRVLAMVSATLDGPTSAEPAQPQNIHDVLVDVPCAGVALDLPLASRQTDRREGQRQAAERPGKSWRAGLGGAVPGCPPLARYRREAVGSARRAAARRSGAGSDLALASITHEHIGFVQLADPTDARLLLLHFNQDPPSVRVGLL